MDIDKSEEKELVFRANKVLMTCLGMSEQQAHKFIQQQAMNLRRTKSEIAFDVLVMYEQ